MTLMTWMFAVGSCREQEQRGCLCWWRAGASVVLLNHRLSRQRSASGKSATFQTAIVLTGHAAVHGLQDVLTFVDHQISVSPYILCLERECF